MSWITCYGYLDVRWVTARALDSTPSQQNIGEVISGVINTGQYSTMKRKLSSSCGDNIILLEVKSSKLDM